MRQGVRQGHVASDRPAEVSALAGSGRGGLEGGAAVNPLMGHLRTTVDRKRASFRVHMLWTKTTINTAFITRPGLRNDL